jgi:hypothetical protein
MRASKRQSLAGSDPLNIVGQQRQHTLHIAAAECGKCILHNLDILLYTHRNPSISPYIGQDTLSAHNWQAMSQGFL